MIELQKLNALKSVKSKHASFEPSNLLIASPNHQLQLGYYMHRASFAKASALQKLKRFCWLQAARWCMFSKAQRNVVLGKAGTGLILDSQTDQQQHPAISLVFASCHFGTMWNYGVLTFPFKAKCHQKVC